MSSVSTSSVCTMCRSILALSTTTMRRSVVASHERAAKCTRRGDSGCTAGLVEDGVEAEADAHAAAPMVVPLGGVPATTCA